VVLSGDYGPVDDCDPVGMVLLGIESEVESAGGGSWGFGDGREGVREDGMMGCFDCIVVAVASLKTCSATFANDSHINETSL
jgi:hypothetical protein